MTPTCTASKYCRCGATGCPMSSFEHNDGKETSFSIDVIDMTTKPSNRHERRKQIAINMKEKKK